MVEEDKVVTNEDNEQYDAQDESLESDNKSRMLSSKNSMIAGVAVVMAFFCYKMFFANKEVIDVVDTDRIIRNDDEGVVNRADPDDVDSLINLGNLSNNNNGRTTESMEQLVPTVPSVDITKIQVPDLSEDLKYSIEKEIEKEIDTTNEYFTKEQVDDLVNEKLSAFEKQMQAMRDESKKLAEQLKEAEEKRLQAEKEDKVKKNLIFAPNKNKDNAMFNADGSVRFDANGKVDPNNPFEFTGSSYDIEREEAKKKEEEELKRVQRNKALTERKTAPMFKMQGGGGGESITEQESIIILDKNLLVNIKDNQQTIVPTKTQDLSMVILQGKIIEATLETAINTDVVSQVRAIVTRDVYAEYGKNILIPKGSRIVGTFSSNVTEGVARLGIVWNRIIRVDGLSLNISAEAADQIGRGGIEGSLDNKYFQLLRNSFLSSLITIATSIAVDEVGNVGGLNIDYDKDSGVTTYSGDATAYAVREATNDFMDDVEDIIDNMKEEKPTIRIAQGTKVMVVVNQDLTLPIYNKKK